VRSLSRRQVAHYSPWACVRTLRSWPVPCPAATRVGPLPDADSRLPDGPIDCGSRGLRAELPRMCLDRFTGWADLGQVDDRPARGERPRWVLPLDAPFRQPQGPGPGRAPAPGRRSGPRWAVRQRRSAHRDRSSARAAGVMTSQVTLAASTPRSASAASSGVLVVLDPRLELGVVSGGVLGDLDPALPDEPLTLTRGTQRPQQRPLKVTDWGSGAYGSAIAAPSARSCHGPTPARGDASDETPRRIRQQGTRGRDIDPVFCACAQFLSGSPRGMSAALPGDDPGDGPRSVR
jgi:hypothetical protein